MIEFIKVSKSYGKGAKAPVVHNLSFHLSEKQSLQIIGAEHTGKSTVLKLICGTEYPSRGKVERQGKLSWIANTLKYEKTMSLVQNLRFYARIAGQNDFTAYREEVDHLLRGQIDFGLKVHEISGLQKRLLSVAATICLPFDVFLFDDQLYPKNQMDDEIETLFRDKIQSLQQIIVASSNVNMNKDFIDAILVLDNEQSRLYSSAEDAREHIAMIHGVV
ncbi:ATP-binding cassette domain-containing protein [Temperatibacter marinus]|uniref:ATP-binding cassette domain-containing protein n=1 Tax=Temperatibacter marinus TaxID=1456591 RepID=A0AA52EJH3_9PROT|nr:ATP-binding cassette domain-containing protein [Temperatibacter marinus]WND03176.1 ATP-binding cassette domain-containing protein [Temperatibacter marinus]